MSYTSMSICNFIGNTPLLELTNIEKSKNLHSSIIAKLELFNSSGSIKDRIAKAMIEDAEEKGLLNKYSIIIEPTSGNTGIALASISASKGYRCILTMPDTMSIERRKILKAYGANIVLTNGAQGMKGSILKAYEILQKNSNCFMPNQFENPINPKIHRETTAPEIWYSLNGNIDIFISGVGTGGTITGCGEFFKKMKPNIKIIAVEPESSPILSKGKSGIHKIQGIGAGFVPKILNTKVYDEVITVTDKEAFETRETNSKG